MRYSKFFLRFSLGFNNFYYKSVIVYSHFDDHNTALRWENIFHISNICVHRSGCNVHVNIPHSSLSLPNTLDTFLYQLRKPTCRKVHLLSTDLDLLCKPDKYQITRAVHRRSFGTVARCTPDRQKFLDSMWTCTPKNNLETDMACTACCQSRNSPTILDITVRSDLGLRTEGSHLL